MMNLRSRLKALTQNQQKPLHDNAEVSPSITDRITRMRETAKQFSVSETEIAQQLNGIRLAEGVIRIDRHIPLKNLHGEYELANLKNTPIHFLNKDIGEINHQKLVFIDTETSGLAGGTGTIAFLLGMAKISEESLHICQWLLLAFRGEQPMLEDAIEWLTSDSCLVSFNGKSFDIPLLTSRYLQNRMQNPFRELKHLDLVHPMRRAFSNVWDDCKLQTAEKNLLKLFRQDDLPGAMMPEIWGRVLRSKQFDMLPQVLEHNHLDILSLPALTGALSQIYTKPGMEKCNLVGIAERHCEDGRKSHALEILKHGKEYLDEQGLLMLASLYRMEGQVEAALDIWSHLAVNGSSEGAERLAKYYEHAKRDYAVALQYAQQIKINKNDVTQRRLSRLHGRLAKQSYSLI